MFFFRNNEENKTNNCQLLNKQKNLNKIDRVISTIDDFIKNNNHNEIFIVNGLKDSFQYVIKRYVYYIDKNFEINNDSIYSKKLDLLISNKRIKKDVSKFVYLKNNKHIYTPNVCFFNYQEILDEDYKEINLIDDVSKILKDRIK